jgi:hypothetical protein
MTAAVADAMTAAGSGNVTATGASSRHMSASMTVRGSQSAGRQATQTERCGECASDKCFMKHICFMKHAGLLISLQQKYAVRTSTTPHCCQGCNRREHFRVLFEIAVDITTSSETILILGAENIGLGKYRDR